MHDAKTHLSRHIAALKGDDRIVICNRNRPVAEVRLLPGARARPRKPGAAKGTFTVPASFFEPLPEDLLAGFDGLGLICCSTPTPSSGLSATMPHSPSPPGPLSSMLRARCG